ncbi:hypothetical protein DFQ05_0454 [Winogradskyella wandonensis]|uniref:Uncharacterized protein n=1 Tax=Winogradskyella wandonensis TaxID=1442586 RepID=A0A4R1KUY4_9FLAO|nr:hypothetical protein [Winogradskyella wandonensis]TCK68944.1 hypothetical protein DFQ05_0454 [Winogradskyella wandonensis]
MVLNNIENLLEKYDNAETTLQEEAQLRAYFSSEDVAPHLEHYKPLFVYFTSTQQEAFTKDVPLNTKKKTRLYQWISVAAVAVLMLGIMIPQVWDNSPKTLADYTPEEQELYNKTKNALAFMSANFNEGTSSLNVLEMASDNLNAGIYKASFVSEFGKTTNKLLK